MDEIADYIDNLTINDEEKQELKKYYDKVWSLSSGGNSASLTCTFLIMNKNM